MRNALVVVRCLRRRLLDYISMYISADFMDEYIKELDRQFSAIEYIRLRRLNEPEKVKEILSRLALKDKEIINRIVDMLRRKYD